MMSKKNLILIFIFGSAAVITLLLDRNTKTQSASDQELKSVISTEQVTSIKKISLSKGSVKLDLTQNEAGFWLINQKLPFPAKADAVVRFIDNLQRSEIQRVIKNGTKKLDEFGIKDDISIQVSSQNGEIKISLGDRRERGGQYAFIESSGSKQLVLIDPPIDLSTEEKMWESNSVLDVDKDDVMSIKFTPMRGSKLPAFNLMRDSEKKDMTVEQLAENEQSNKVAINDFLAALTSISFEEKIIADKRPDDAFLFTIDLSNQQKLELRIFEEQMSNGDIEDTEKSTEQKSYFASIKAMGLKEFPQTEVINTYFSPYDFRLSKRTFEKIIVSREKLVQVRDKKESKDTVESEGEKKKNDG